MRHLMISLLLIFFFFFNARFVSFHTSNDVFGILKEIMSGSVHYRHKPEQSPTKRWRALRHHPLCIWRRHLSLPCPRWSEANLPTPLCRILGIAAHRAAVMCHLAPGPVGGGTLPDLSVKVPHRGEISQGHLTCFLPMMVSALRETTDTYQGQFPTTLL